MTPCRGHGRSARVVASGVSAPEGPTVGPDGWILNVCSFTRESNRATRGGDIVATRPSTGTRLLFNTSTAKTVGIPAAMAFGPDGALYITDEGHRAVLRAAPDGHVGEFVATPNGPNDLFFDDRGDLWVTDPWGSTLERRCGAVYVVRSGTAELEQVARGLAFPNGIVRTGAGLIFAETRTGLLWLHRAIGERDVGPAEVFAQLPRVPGVDVQGPDGMALDVNGNLYVAHYGAGCVRVYTPAGTELAQIPVPGRDPTNVCFGGDGLKTLYVTLDDTDELVAVEVDAAGRVLAFCPSVTPDTASAWRERLVAAESLRA